MSGDAWEGGGIIDSVVDVSSGIATMDLTVGEGVGAALNAIGIIANPLSGLLSAGAGMLIEHVGFLEEPLNDLAGDPDAIEAVAQTWAVEVRTELLQARDGYAASVTAVGDGWTNEAAEAYQVAAAHLQEAIIGMEAGAVGVADAVRGAGVIVATIRTVIRDIVADLVGELVASFLASVASSWFTLGGSVAAFISWAVYRSTVVAGRLAGKIANLIQRLNDVLDRFRRLGGLITSLRTVTERLASFSRSAPEVAVLRGLRADLGLDSAARGATRALADITSTGVSRAARTADDVVGSDTPLGAGTRAGAYRDTSEDTRQDAKAADREAQVRTAP